VKFAPEGIRVTTIAAIASIVASMLLGEVAGLVGLLLTAGVLLFFRDPERRPPGDPSAVVSPADGRVVFAETGARPHRFSAGSTTKVAIFMSPLDVHVNRSPLDAALEKVDHRAGQFAGAYRADAGDINESVSLLLRTKAGAEVVVVQIAGWLARRIICRVAPPLRLSRGERFGLIMFGSRVDVYLPPGARLAVRVGETVKAGETILAWLEGDGALHETKAA
jgi:phosphatidylserine decarboxylase